jgi:hypothetical protein
MNKKHPQNAGVLARMPADLHYLIAPVLRCACGSEADACHLLDTATEKQMGELAAIAHRVLKNGHYPLVMRFLDKYEITDYEECAQLYFFFGLLDHAGLSFDRVPGE